MSRSTSSGWETMATWLVETSTLVAPMRGANCRWASGGIAWSPSAMRKHVGRDFHAGTPITSPSALQCNGCWTANMTSALVGSTSAAKCFTKSSSGSQANPDVADVTALLHDPSHACERPTELVARTDVELGVDLVQVPFDRARADEQLGTDFGVRQTLACETGDLRLLRRENIPRPERPSAGRLAGR